MGTRVGHEDVTGGRLGEGGSSQARRRIILVRRLVRRLDRPSAKRGGGSFSVGGSFSNGGSLGVGGSPLYGIAISFLCCVNLLYQKV